MIFFGLIIIAAFFLMIVLPIVAMTNASQALRTARESKKMAGFLYDIVMSKETYELSKSTRHSTLGNATSGNASQETKAYDSRAKKSPSDSDVVHSTLTNKPNFQTPSKNETNEHSSGLLESGDIQFDEVKFLEPNKNSKPIRPQPKRNERTHDPFVPTASEANASKEYASKEYAAAKQGELTANVNAQQDHQGPVRPTTRNTPTVESHNVSELAKDSFELRLGSYWFVRIGVVLLLSGLVFLAYTKRQFFFGMAPALKVAGFYGFSLILAGIGFGIQRTHEKLKNYGQVLMAGGFAGVYFTTYAAHIFPPMQIIESQTLVIGLLLAWGACLFYYSDRIQSETVAIFATGASYYATFLPLIHVSETSAWIVLASNLILAMTSVGFMIKNNWVKLSTVSLVASYTGLAFCLPRIGNSHSELFIASAIALWAIYTVAIFVSRNKAASDAIRAIYLSVNNVVATSIVSYVVLTTGIIESWLASMLGGLMFLGCSAFLSFKRKELVISANAYLAQGLLLANFGLITFGMTGSLVGPVIAVQTVALMSIALNKRDSIMEGIGAVCAAASVGFVSWDLFNASPHALSAALIVSMLMFALSFIFGRTSLATGSTVDSGDLQKAIAFSIMAYLAAGLAIFTNMDAEAVRFAGPLIMILLPTVCHLTHWYHRNGAWISIGIIFAGIGVGLTCYQIINDGIEVGTAFAMVAMLVHMHIWQLSRVDEAGAAGVGVWHTFRKDLAEKLNSGAENIYALFFSVSLLCILTKSYLMSNGFVEIANPGLMSFMLAGSIASAGLLAYALATRTRWLGIQSQLFWMIAALVMVATCLSGESNNPLVYACPILVGIGQWILAKLVMPKLDIDWDRDPNAKTALYQAYTTVLISMSVIWIETYVASSLQIVAITAFSITLFTHYSLNQNRNFLWQPTLLAAIAGFQFLGEAFTHQLSMPQVIAVIAVMIAQQVVRRKNSLFQQTELAHRFVTIICSALLFIALSVPSEIQIMGNTESKTLVWTLFGFGLMTIGLIARERSYRIGGLAVLALALTTLAPAFLGMSTELKILSTFVMGAVFVGLGFVYTRFKDRIRELL